MSLLVLARPAEGELRSEVFDNTALIPPAIETTIVPALDVSIARAGPFSAELSGSLSPPLPAGWQPRWRFKCTFSNISVAWLWLDDHCICQHGAYNNSANGVFDGDDLRLLRKRSDLPVRMHITRGTRGGTASVSVYWCPLDGDGRMEGPCAPIPAKAITPTLSTEEVIRVAMQRKLASGWGSWLFRDLSSLVYLPDSAVITPYICQLSTRKCVYDVQEKGGGGGDEDPPGTEASSVWGSRVRVGAKSPESNYAQISYLFETTATGDGLNLTLTYATCNGTEEKRNEELDLLLEAKPLIAPGSSAVQNLSDYIIAFTGTFAWGRVGTGFGTPRGLQLQGHGLRPLNLSVTAAAMEDAPPIFFSPGGLSGTGCSRDGDCASGRCDGKGTGGVVPSAQLVPCNASDPSQKWEISQGAHSLSLIKHSATGACLSFSGGLRGVGACKSSTEWKQNSPNPSQFQADGAFAGQCLDAHGADVQVWHCHDEGSSDFSHQEWAVHGDLIVNKAGGQCLAVGNFGKHRQGICTEPAQRPHYVVQLNTETTVVGLTSRGVNEATISAISKRIAAAATAQQMRHRQFGLVNEDVTEAITAAVGWRTIFCPAEAGPILPTTYGFTWITPGAETDDWKYVMFDWDNIFASYIAGILGYKEVAFSNLIQIIKAKASTGYVPDWAAGGSKHPQSEPQVGGRVLWELHRRYPRDVWLVELLLDDLLDWHDWAWNRRRVIGDAGGICADPGFLTLGNDDCERTRSCDDLSAGPQALKSSCQGESGQDQSPLWDCPDASIAGSGGDCARLIDNRTWTAMPGSKELHGAVSMHVMQLGDTQSTTLFVNEAHALAKLARAVNRNVTAAALEERAEIMTAQLRKLWSADVASFNDAFCKPPSDGSTGSTHSKRLTPNIFYPMMIANATTVSQAETMVRRHLFNPLEFCIARNWSADKESLPDNCYWGLPSIAANDESYMQPPTYIYWRGFNWGPMTIFTYWALDGMAAQSQVIKAARTALAQQKTAAMMDIWRRRRHICENYPMYRPGTVPQNVCKIDPKTGARQDCMGTNSTECTGGHFYHWGALNGLTTLLEAEGLGASEILVGAKFQRSSKDAPEPLSVTRWLI